MSDAPNMRTLAIQVWGSLGNTMTNMRDGDQLKAQAEASAAKRIAEAPRAWARVYGPGDYRIIYDIESNEDAEKFAAVYGFKIARIALVELKPEEGE